MAEITLRASAGRRTGSSESRRLRRQGLIPAVVYGHGMEARPVAVDGRELRAALSGDAGLNAVLALQVDGERYTALTREIQRHPVRGTVLHVDFQVVDPDESVTAEVPVVLTGDAVEVAHADGVVDQQLFTLTVRAKPSEIPTVIEVDISGLTVGGTIRAGEIALPAGAGAELDPDTVVVMGLPPRVQARGEEEGTGGTAGSGTEG
jgi:large subunit ribosomal protein L25